MTTTDRVHRFFERVRAVTQTPEWAEWAYRAYVKQERPRFLGWREPEGDAHAEHLSRLELAALRTGYRVRYANTSNHWSGAAAGYCDPITRNVVVSESLTPDARVRTLAHELAHALGALTPPYGPHGYTACEVIAESVACLYCEGIGLDVADTAAPYVAHYAHDHTRRNGYGDWLAFMAPPSIPEMADLGQWSGWVAGLLGRLEHLAVATCAPQTHDESKPVSRPDWFDRAAASLAKDGWPGN